MWIIITGVSFIKWEINILCSPLEVIGLLTDIKLSNEINCLLIQNLSNEPVF